MLNVLFRKWWMLLIQGIVLIILSIYIFNNPAAVLAGISVWFGILVLASGLLGVVAWLAADHKEEEIISFLWNLITIFLGLILLFNIPGTMKVLTMMFGIWMLLTGLKLGLTGWSLKNDHSFGWVMVIAAVLSAVAGFIMIFNITSGAKGISMLLGLQVLLTGIALVLLSFAKKVVMNNINEKITSLKSRIQH